MRRLVWMVLLGLWGGCSSPSSAPPDADAGRRPEARPPPVVDEADRRFADALTGHRRERYREDLEGIKRRGVLRVLTRNSATSYFLYRGAEAGFDYELAKLLAKELGVRLEVVVPAANRDLIPWLLEGRGDVIIAAIASDGPRVDRVRLTRPYLKSPLTVVTRKGRVPAIRAIADLSRATILLQPTSSAMKRMRALGAKTGLTFNLRAARETLMPEDLLDMVASGDADATIVEKRIAKLELMHRDDIEMALELPGGDVESSFAVRPDDKALFAVVDGFLKRHYRDTIFNILYKRYHENSRRASQVHDEEYRADRRGALSPWDDAFKQAAKTAGVDWRLLAAQAYQESRFDPQAESSFGAKGVMQLMPATAREVGVTDLTDPLQSIAGGARYMAKLIKRYTIDGIALKDRIRFALAAYNVGPGHLTDARALAKSRSLDPNRWFGNVEKAMLLLSKPRYYRKARYGYARGEEPRRYVSEIQTRYDNYVALTDPAAEQKPGSIDAALETP